MATISNPNKRSQRFGLTQLIKIFVFIFFILLVLWKWSISDSLLEDEIALHSQQIEVAMESPTRKFSSNRINKNDKNGNNDNDNNWCDNVAKARKDLNPDLAITVPCETMKPARSAVVCYLTAGLPDGKGGRAVFTGTDYINGALALGASLKDHVTRSDTHMLLLIRDGFTMPPEKVKNLEAVGWTLGKAPKVDVAQKYAPRFERYKTVYTKISIIGLSEYECVLLLDADALVVGNIDDLLSCQILSKKTTENNSNNYEENRSEDDYYRVAGTLDYYRGKWYHFNTGSALWKTSTTEMNRVYQLTKDPKFMQRFQSDQIFSNTVYPDRTNVTLNEMILSGAAGESSYGQVAHMGWEYNAQTHVEVEKPEYWEEHLSSVKIFHYTERKGWQCPERHGGPPVPKKQFTKKGKECSKNPDCACNEGYRWYDYLDKAKSIGGMMTEK